MAPRNQRTTSTPSKRIWNAVGYGRNSHTAQPLRWRAACRLDMCCGHAAGKKTARFCSVCYYAVGTCTGTFRSLLEHLGRAARHYLRRGGTASPATIRQASTSFGRHFSRMVRLVNWAPTWACVAHIDGRVGSIPASEEELASFPMHQKLKSRPLRHFPLEVMLSVEWGKTGEAVAHSIPLSIQCIRNALLR